MRVIGYISGALVSVVAASLLFRHLGVQQTGEYVTALSLVAIVAAFSDLGLTAVAVREMSNRPVDERWELARDLLGLRIALTCAGAAIVVAIAWIGYSTTMALGVALACGGLALQATQDNFSLPLLLGLRLGWISVLELARQLLSTAIIVALVLLDAPLVPFLGVSIPVGAALVPVTVLLVRGTRRLAPSFNVRRWRRFATAAIPYTLAVAASALYFRASILLVSILGGSLQLGYFGASFRIVEVLAAVPGLLVSAAFPIFARAAHDDHARLGYALQRVFEVALVVGAWTAVSIAVGAPLGIAIIGGAKFAPAVPVLAVQGVALGAMFVSLVWANALLSLGLYRSILALGIFTLVLNVALVSALIPLDGAQGAAIGTSIAEIAGAIAQAAVVARGRHRLRPSLRPLPLVALASAAGLAPLAMAGVPTIGRVAISTVLFGSVILATRALPSEVFALLPWQARRSGGAEGRTP